MLALVHVDMGKPEEALTFAEQAMQIYQASNAEEEAGKLGQLISQVRSEIGS